jgi:hypothetical protein
MKTILTYKLNGVTYNYTFAGRVSYGTVERYLVMEKHIGVSQHRNAIVEIKNLLN